MKNKPNHLYVKMEALEGPGWYTHNWGNWGWYGGPNIKKTESGSFEVKNDNNGFPIPSSDDIVRLHIRDVDDQGNVLVRLQLKYKGIWLPACEIDHWIPADMFEELKN